MRILIISYYFPPYNAVGATRISKLAEHWLDAGHDVVVLAADDQPFAPSLPKQFPQHRIRYTRWLNINALPELISGGRKKVANSGYASKRSVALKLGQIYKTLLNFPDGQIGWYPYGVQAGRKLLNREGWVPDLIYASAHPITSLLIARKLAVENDVPWVAELRDLWVGNPYHDLPAWRRMAERKFERWILSSASALVTVSEPLADALHSTYKLPVATVMNGFDPRDYVLNSPNPFPDHTLNIVYTGMIYPNKRDPSPLFEALSKLSCANKIHVYFYGRYLQFVKQLAERYGVGHLVSVSEVVPYLESVQLQMHSDVLLLLLWNDKRDRGVLTGKLFEYFGAQHPILAIGPEECMAGKMIAERKAGIISHDPTVIAEHLKKWVEIKERDKSGFKLDADVSQGLTRKDQFQHLDRFLSANRLLLNAIHG